MPDPTGDMRWYWTNCVMWWLIGKGNKNNTKCGLKHKQKSKNWDVRGQDITLELFQLFDILYSTDGYTLTSSYFWPVELCYSALDRSLNYEDDELLCMHVGLTVQE